MNQSSIRFWILDTTVIQICFDDYLEIPSWRKRWQQWITSNKEKEGGSQTLNAYDSRVARKKQKRR
jgi:hypothetical protein